MKIVKTRHKWSNFENMGSEIFNSCTKISDRWAWVSPEGENPYLMQYVTDNSDSDSFSDVDHYIIFRCFVLTSIELLELHLSYSRLRCICAHLLHLIYKRKRDWILLSEKSVKVAFSKGALSVHSHHRFENTHVPWLFADLSPFRELE